LTATKTIVPLLDLKDQYASLREDLFAAAQRVLDSGRFILGDEGAQLEQEFAAAQGTQFCAGISSGTQALEVALEALGVGPGDEVAVPSFTFIATATAVSALGATPLFVDVHPNTLTLDAGDLKKRISAKTKAVIPVHLYGHPADMDGIMGVAHAAGLKVVEDCAQAHLTRSRGRAVGSIGDFGAFSFYPSKNLGAIGDAGALTSSDAALDEQARVIRNVGRSPGRQYEHVAIGRNYRLDEMQAAFLRVKLRHLEDWTNKRRAIADRYRTGLAGLPVRLPRADQEGDRSVYHLFTLQTDKRDALSEKLKGEGIGCAVYYPTPLHLQAAYRHLNGKPGDLPASERASREALSLPMFPELPLDKVDIVCSAVRDFYKTA
jgi:dTDP-4-amino-4,6-dideoxygalactose transaminase